MSAETTTNDGETPPVATEDLNALAKSSEPSSLALDSIERTWDHTNRRAIVYNINKFMMNKDLPKLEKEWNLGSTSNSNSKDSAPNINITKWKKPPKASWVMVTLETEAMLEPFLSWINSSRFTNKRGQAIYAKSSNSKLEQELEGQDTRDTSTSTNKEKRNERNDRNYHEEGNNDDGNPAKRLKLTDDDVRNKLIPLWKLPYTDQLKQKKTELIKHSCMKIVQEVKNKFKSIEKEAKRNAHRKKVNMYAWVTQKRAIEVQDIISSPLIQEYRNKSELTFGYRDTTVPAVGFLAAGWAGGVSRPHMLHNVPWEVCAVADIMDDFLASCPIPPYDSRNHRGLWRTLTIRSSKRTGQMMLVIIHAPPTGGAGGKDDDYTKLFEPERNRLITMLTAHDLSPTERTFVGTAPITTMKVTSVFFQDYDGLSNPRPDHPVQHIFGNTCISENLGDCTFQISPGAFFQVNTECAELLYQQVVNQIRLVCPDPENTILIDVCCGTGTIGITCIKAGVVSTVIGVDISEPAIADAERNAIANKLDNSTTRFVANRAELVMLQELNKVKHLEKTIVAVVDPAREGLHGDVIRALRMNEQIQRLIYVSCNPTGSLIKDAGLLCAPPTKKYSGRAFRPTAAQAVDMFPMTTHCEMILTFDRLTDDEVGGNETQVEVTRIDTSIPQEASKNEVCIPSVNEVIHEASKNEEDTPHSMAEVAQEAVPL